MTPEARRQLSQTLLQRSDDEFGKHGGNTHIAAELLWGAAAQLLLTVIDTDETLTFKGHDSYPEAAERVEELSREPFAASDYHTANRLHVHFYEGQLTGKDLTNIPRITKRLIKRLEAYLTQTTNGDSGG